MPPRAPSFLDNARSFLERHASTPIVGGAARAGALIISAAAPFSGQTQSPANIPPAAWSTDQPIAPQGDPDFRAGYHDHTFTNSAAPMQYGGRTIEIARSDLEQHDSGVSFYGSSILTQALVRFAPVFAALGVRCAPSIALPRIVLGGSRGLARVVRAEVEEQLAPSMGLLPSACFQSTLWGAIAIDLAMMGFAVLQHVYGAPDARGVRRIYTRRWPTWAVYYLPYRRTYVAITSEGPVDILNDGKFTLIGKTDIPHMQGAIRGLMLPALDGVQVIQARAQWIDRYSDPKFIATMPPNIAPKSDIGRALYAAIATMRGPGGYGVLPNGTTFQAVGLDSKASTCFKDALESDATYIAAVLTGTDLSAGTGGVYKAPVFWGILRSTVGDDLAAQKRGINHGHVYPYTRFNYEAGIEEAEERGLWVDPVLDIPLPNPETDAQNAANATRQQAFYAAIGAEKDAGGAMTQERVDALAKLHGANTFVMAEAASTPIARLDLAPTDVAKIVKVDEARRSQGLAPIGDERGDLTIAEMEEAAKATAEKAKADAEKEAASGEPAQKEAA